MSIASIGSVALESTVISHGLPYPHNLRLALRLEEIVREGGSASSPAKLSSG
jgi:pseudouridine-5'-phosphate glycosidase